MRFAPLLDSVPEAVRVRSRRGDFIRFVVSLQVPRAVKRRLVVEWCRSVSHPVTPQIFEDCGASRVMVRSSCRGELPAVVEDSLRG